MLTHPLSNFEIRIYYENESKFNSFYSRNDLPEIKDGEFVINLDEYKSIETLQIVLHVNGDNVIFFESFGDEYIPIVIKNFTDSKMIKLNIYRTKSYNSIICECFCIGLIDFMLNKERLVGFTNLFSQNKFQKNCETALEYFH